MEIITSRTNQYIKLCHSLQDKKSRKKLSLCLLEGIKIIREAVKNNLVIENIYSLEDNVVDLEREFGQKVIPVSKQILEYISSTVTPQYCVGVARVKEENYSLPQSNYLLLDNIQDPSNMGAIIRTAVATGFTTIYLNNCVDEYNEKVIRSSMGNLFKCKFIHIKMEQIKDLKESLYICDMNGKNIFNILAFNQIVGLCIGNEGHGVSKEIRSEIKNVISLPMMNEVESLNAAVSSSVIMYHIKVNQKEK